LLTTDARHALRLRLANSKASIKKLPKILEQLSPDDRLRNQYAFYKAHTGRWAGKGAQLQNLKAARTKEEKAMVAEVVKLLEQGDPVPSLDALSLALRPLMTAPKGKKIVLADFSSVENRVLAWASGCEAMAAVYKAGKDPYIDFAARMEGIDYGEVTAELRQQAKPGVLGCGFGLGGGQLVRKCVCANQHAKHTWNVKVEILRAPCPICANEVDAGLPTKTGLWKYAEAMGIDLSQGEAMAQVEAFRDTFMEVAEFWYYLEEAFAACCLKRRNQTIESSLGCKLVFRWADPALRIVLPSGRELVYPNAYARVERTPFGGKKLTLGYEVARGSSWGGNHTYGGKLCENIVQAIALDLTWDAMFRVEDIPGLDIVGHTHDEIICLADEADKTALPSLIAAMSTVDEWAKGIPMAADGYEGRRYVKG
jgi:DNA polymerase bacteriophage-type